MKFSEQLFDFRVRYQLTQRQTAEILGISQQSVTDYELEKRAPERMRQEFCLRKMRRYEENKKRSDKNV